MCRSRHVKVGENEKEHSKLTKPREAATNETAALEGRELPESPVQVAAAQISDFLVDPYARAS